MTELDVESINEAEQYYIKASSVLHMLQANKQVYGSNSRLAGVASPADVDLGLQYIDRSLEIMPENAVYLNLKALLLWEGKGNKDSARILLEKAAQLKPRDIDIQNNLNAIKTSQCVIATAAYGSPLADEVNLLRRWRDKYLCHNAVGRALVRIYYLTGKHVAAQISRNEIARKAVRILLYPVVFAVKNFSSVGRD